MEYIRIKKERGMKKITYQRERRRGRMYRVEEKNKGCNRSDAAEKWKEN